MRMPQVIFFSEGGEKPTVSHPRLVVKAGADSHVTFTESYLSQGGVCLANGFTRVELGHRATVVRRCFITFWGGPRRSLAGAWVGVGEGGQSKRERGVSDLTRHKPSQAPTLVDIVVPLTVVVVCRYLRLILSPFLLSSVELYRNIKTADL